MSSDLVTLVSRWTRSTNRRVVLEEGLRGLGWIAIAGVIAAAIHRLPALLGRLHVSWPDWLPGEPTMATLAYGLGSVALVLVAVRMIVRIRRRRIDALGMARRIDEQQGTPDLLATALAVEAGT
nr:hypothetical protein [Deltaproteobacteria bacterium]